jgi:hypothetical protein
LANELDTSWFDLSKYRGIDTFGLREWERQLSVRSYMWWCSTNDSESFPEICDIWLERIKTAPLIPNYEGDKSTWQKQREYNPACFYSVFSTPAYHFWCAPNDNRLSDVWAACSLEDEGKATEEQYKLANTPYNWLYFQRGVSSEELTNVVVDLTASDEQIIKDFRKWLIAYRKACGFYSHEKNFTIKNFAEWNKWRLLPYIDLILVGKANRAEITQPRIARLIFDDEFEVDIVDRLRRTTKPKAEWLIREETVTAMRAQIEGEA